MGADINPNFKAYQKTGLLLAAQLGDGNSVKEILSYVDVDPNIGDFTALHLAAQNGYLDIARDLLSHSNADPNVKNKSGLSALYIACTRGFISIVEEILSHPNADPNVADDDCEHVPIYAAAKNRVLSKLSPSFLAT